MIAAISSTLNKTVSNDLSIIYETEKGNLAAKAECQRENWEIASDESRPKRLKKMSGYER